MTRSPYPKDTRTLLVLGASRYQLPTILRARELGHRVVCIDNVPGNPGHCLADRSYVVSTTDIPAALNIAESEQVTGVLAPCTDVAVLTQAAIAEVRRIPGPTSHAARVLTHKQVFRDYCRKLQLPAPDWITLNSSWNQAEVPSFLASGPAVVKPCHSSGSKGIFIVRNLTELEAVWDEVQSYAGTAGALLERQLTGHHGTVEGILQDGQVVRAWLTDRLTAPEPFVATVGHRWPGRYSETTRSALLEAIATIFQQLKLTDTVFDADFIVTETGPCLLELTPRLGGNSLSELFLLAGGIDLPAFAIEQSLGLNPGLPTSQLPLPTYLQLFGSDVPGELSYGITGLELAQQLPGVLKLEMDVPPGSTVSDFRNGRCRFGEAIYQAATELELQQLADEAWTLMDLRVRSPDTAVLDLAALQVGKRELIQPVHSAVETFQKIAHETHP